MFRPSGHSLWGNYDDGGSLPENKREGDVRNIFLSYSRVPNNRTLCRAKSIGVIPLTC